jgi:hypothetical protein
VKIPVSAAAQSACQTTAACANCRNRDNIARYNRTSLKRTGIRNVVFVSTREERRNEFFRNAYERGQIKGNMGRPRDELANLS